jgi:DNA-binding IclR family transcriptional regulator
MNDTQTDLTGPQADIACILAALYQGGEAARPSLSLAALSKRIDMRMSTLQRYLTTLQEEGWVALSGELSTSRQARLTPVGEKMCEEWWGAGAG